jgi:peptidoglycan/LPS O-acetylase OafA/YrhL
VLWHSFTTAYGLDYAHAVLATPYRPIIAAIVPIFFALSGFLVAASLFRNPITTFVGLRVLRIVPALAVETVLSAFILGAIVTTLPLSRYFTSPGFFKYLCNILGWVHYSLPGVFHTNPYPDRVNGQLWTVPWELWCYFALTAAAVLGIVRNRVLFMAMTVVGTLGYLAFDVLVRRGEINLENGVHGPVLLLPFLSAVSLYLFRDRLPWSGRWCLTAAFASCVLLETPGGEYLLGFPIAYVAIYVGLLNPVKIGLLRGADYSYGLYIYHYVIQQTVVFLAPGQRHWYVVFSISMVLGGAFAALSWTFIEKPALRLRSRLGLVERAIDTIGSKLATLRVPALR